MDIVDILSESNVPFRMAGQHHHATHSRIQTDCPYCSPDSDKFRLGIRLNGTGAACWVCGSKSIVEVLRQLTGLPFRELKKLIGNLPAVRKETQRPRGKLELPAGLGPLLQAHENYLAGRGYDVDAVAQLWGLRGIGPASDYAWRIWIPYHHQGEIVTWTTRSISDEGLRYKAAKPHQESISHKDLLGGEDFCKHAIIVCEGPLDALAIGPGATWLHGLTRSAAQILAISKYPKRAFCLDAEGPAQRVAREFCNELSVFPGETSNIILDYKDASETLKKKPSDIALLRKTFLR